MGQSGRSRRIGYSVMEDQELIESGNKRVMGDKNIHSLSKIERLMMLFQPTVLVLQDLNANGSPGIDACKVQPAGRLPTGCGLKLVFFFFEEDVEGGQGAVAAGDVLLHFHFFAVA